jgi:hypothetical protein
LWGKEKIAMISTLDMQAFTKDQLSKIPTEKMGDFVLVQLKSIPWDKIGTFSKEQWDKVPVDTIALLGWEQLQQVDYGTLAAWTKEQWVKIPVDKLVKLSGDQISKISPDQVAEWSQLYWNQVPVYHVVKFAAELFAETGILPNLDAEKIALMSAEQWAKVPIAELSKLTVKQLKAIDYDALASWSQDKWDAIPVDKLVLLTGKQIRAIPATTVAAWTKEQWLKVPIKELVMLKGEQINNKATLAKLTIDMLVNLNQGELDTSLLEAEVRRQLEEALKARANNAVDQTKLVGDIIKYYDAKKNVADANLKVESAKADPAATPAQVQAAEMDASSAKIAESNAMTTLAQQGYTVDAQQASTASITLSSRLLVLFTIGLASLVTAL